MVVPASVLRNASRAMQVISKNVNFLFPSGKFLQFSLNPALTNRWMFPGVPAGCFGAPRNVFLEVLETF